MSQVPQFPHIVQANMQSYIDALGEDAALFISPPHVTRSNDTEYEYRQSSDILYLCGWRDPDMAMLIRPKADKPIVMFVQPKDPTREIWTGIRPGVEGAKRDFGANEAYNFSELSKQLPHLLMGVERLHYAFAENTAMDKLLMNSIQRANRLGRTSGLAGPDVFVHPSRTLHRLRQIKSEAEIEVMRKTVAITKEAHEEAMAMTAPGVFEYQIEAKISYVFRSNGGTGPGYTSIVGGGNNAVILHYISNDQPLRDGDVVCVDAGCELGSYTGDVTRSWPVNGRFTEGQRDIYEAVLAANEAAIAACKPGIRYREIHEASVQSLTESMVRLGLLEGEVDEIIANEGYKKFFMHGTGHWLGMDVHDVGAYVDGIDSIIVEAGMILTVEPGIYIDANDDSVPERYRGIGIRLEDDILITADGYDNLSKDIPKSVEAVERLVGSKA